MSKVTKTRAKRAKKLTERELKALELVAKEPAKSNRQISKDLIELGQVKDDEYLQARIVKNPIIANKIAHLREKYQLRITNQVPAALKTTKFHLKNNNLKAAALVMKHALPPQEDAPIKIDTINIEYLQVLQQNQLKTCEDRLKQEDKDS